MDEGGVGRLLVVEEKRPVGLITRTGITRFLRYKSVLDGDAESAPA